MPTPKTILSNLLHTLKLTPFTPSNRTWHKAPKSHPKPGPPPQAIHSDPFLYTRQAACPLISKLPIELRDAVWEYVLGHRTVHMYWQDRDTLRGFVCDMQGGDGAQKKTCISMAHAENRGKELRWGSANHIDEKQISQVKGFMPLFLTCRAVYISPVFHTTCAGSRGIWAILLTLERYFETTRVLYATTHFDFTDHWPLFQYLPWSLPLASINQIGHVRIVAHGVPFPDHTGLPTADSIAWTKLWDTLALLKNLRVLEVEVVPPEEIGNVPPGMAGYRLVDELLRPVLIMRVVVGSGEKTGRRKWVVKVPFGEEVDGSLIARGLESAGWRVERV
ncbi:hypothetical protein K458DRAFT_406703 [Lentithecium fluviatile CBS 122367]|uniref:DUF7730 domain-containing protein n=1 Tax=Lentithecium fluviatile CBS 122367 TaxID=1168545 RepID=A0A6G1ITR3_9PLEO|nr:hypothetical protein K458DRAFT_406703 [Lentithecium fluviatile CBS 122367]